jgi:uncharacterized protein
MEKDIQDLLLGFKKLLQLEFGNQLSKIILFGSYANGKATELSDIDIAVILNFEPDWHVKQKVHDLAFDAEGNSGRLLNVAVFSKREFESRSIDSLMLIENITEQGISV